MRNALKSKVVLITGSSVGIGRATACQFAKEGAKVAITYSRQEKEAQRTAGRCREEGASDTFVGHLDLSNDQTIGELISDVVDRFGEISVLTNNAGVAVWKKLGEQSGEEIENQIRVNFEGLVKLTKEASPFVKDVIINIASGAAMHGYGGLSVYSATKWAVRGFTKSLAQELEIPVYVVNPGVTATAMTGFSGTPPEKVAEIVVEIAKGKIDLPSGSDINAWEFDAKSIRNPRMRKLVRETLRKVVRRR